MAEQAIQKSVLFYGDSVIAVQEQASGDVFVPIGRLCDNLGVRRQRQLERVREHDVLAEGIKTFVIETEGGPQQSECLRLDFIPLWLTSIQPSRVKPEVAEKLRRYQREAAKVLWQAFRNDIVPPAEQPIVPSGRSGAELALEIATAVQHLALQQLEIERSVQQIHGRMDGMARFLGDFASRTDERLATLELYLSPEAPVSEEQAAQIALAVKTVGSALAATTGSSTAYQTIYDQMYRRFGVTSYKRLPKATFDAVLTWLHQWHAELTGATPQTSA